MPLQKDSESGDDGEAESDEAVTSVKAAPSILMGRPRSIDDGDDAESSVAFGIFHNPSRL